MSSDSVIVQASGKAEGFRGAGAIALPAAWAYEGVIRLRNWLFDIGIRNTYESKLFTISVGGIEAGGVGKSPVTQYLLGQLLKMDRRPALVSRGYGRHSDGLVIRHLSTPAVAADIGDEPAMMVAAGLDVPIAVCASRKDAVRALEVKGQCDVLVLDDGFAHRALCRHLEVVVLRAEAPFGSGQLLPAGTLREPAAGLKRAHILWFHDKRGACDEKAIAQARALAPQALCIRSEGSVVGARDGRGQPLDFSGARVVAAAGIARPADLRHTLERAGLEVATLMAYPDHHVFTLRDVEHMRAACQQHRAQCVAVTAKDAVKLEALWQDDPEGWMVLDYGVSVGEGVDQLMALLNQTV